MFRSVNTADSGASDKELLAVADRWVALMESEDYVTAMEFVGPGSTWTAELLEAIVKAYGEEDPRQKVTLTAEPTDITQTRDVTRSERDSNGVIGYVWYDLGIDGYVTDLTATFDLIERDGTVIVQLDDIHVH